MAPNLLLKAGFVRGDYDSKETVTKCRTDFILQNVYFLVIKNDSTFKPMSAVNSKEERVFMIYKAIIEEFRDSYTNTIQNMTKRMQNVPLEFISQLLQTVSAELFCEGITWSKVIGFFVFVGELALQRITNDKSGDATKKIYECFCRHVKETLITWVEDNGGWEGLECLSLKNDSALKLDATSDLNPTKSSEQVWYKSFATGAFRVVGTLFQLASPHVQSYA
ncbi:Apoptosis regulator R11 like protein [Argiope bruennichi]|uniref:Apoptosis regulator R11 like protein n=1 Tax=Argiope bruennichi TaxID=94029 RepID=A0A8T0FMJ0_ARGBR|nr:Apoptosis regulator R11 like protein [Argiope bruennichi]